jgi:hypothetical protein
MAGFVLYGGLPVSSLTTKAGLVDAFELALIVKAIELVGSGDTGDVKGGCVLPRRLCQGLSNGGRRQYRLKDV